MTVTPSLQMISVLAGSAVLCAGGTLLLLRRRGTLGMDNPDTHRKLHDKPVLRLGGLPIFVTLMAGFALAAWWLPGMLGKWQPIIVTNAMLFAVGFVDDLRPLGAKVKFFFQISAACFLYAWGISIQILSNPFGAGAIDLGAWSFPVTVIWLVAIPNLINLIDGMDGLATGFGLFLSLTLAFVGHFNGQADTVLISVVMSGALIGFLFFNFPPAKIFLGDGGAYLIGFFIASSSLLSTQKGSILAALMVMSVALGVPILDTVFAISRRALRGVPIFRADADHIHHRLILLGFSKTRALIALYSASVALSLIGISILIGKGFALPVAGSALCLLALGAARYLGYVKSWTQLRRQMQGAMERRRDMLFTHACARVAEWEAERCASAEEFQVQIRHALERVSLLVGPNGADTEAVNLQVTPKITCRLHHVKGSHQDHERWLAKADAFVPALVLAVERWGPLSALDMNQNGGNPPEQPRA